MMKKSIEEVINNWKNKLDNQTKKFLTSAEHLREFENKFLKYCETVTSLFELTNILKEDADGRKRKLEDLSRDEDMIIEQLTVMDKELDQYINLMGQSHPEMAKKYEETGEIYSQTQEISSTMREVQSDLNELNQRVSAPLQLLKNSKEGFSFEGPDRQKVTVDQNDFTTILNSYYDGLKSIQMMEEHLTIQLQSIEEELKERTRSRGNWSRY